LVSVGVFSSLFFCPGLGTFQVLWPLPAAVEVGKFIPSMMDSDSMTANLYLLLRTRTFAQPIPALSSDWLVHISCTHA
jgi:hypothetical protein